MTHLACMFHFFHTCPSFATLRHPFLGIIPHPLANCLAPNRNRRCCPLSFRSLVFSLLLCPSFFKVLPCLHFMFFFKPFPAFSSGFQEFPSCNFLTFPTVSSISLVFQVCHSFFPPVSCFFSQFSSIFLHVH